VRLTATLPEEFQILLDAVVRDNPLEILLHGCGNYVIQVVLTTASHLDPAQQGQLLALVESLLPSLAVISQQNFGKKVESAIADAVNRLLSVGVSIRCPIPVVIQNIIHHVNHTPTTQHTSSTGLNAQSPEWTPSKARR
jgi:hypothetical protein